MDKEAKTVTESRDVTTTPYAWDSDAFAWKESPKDAKVTTETRTRPMTLEEIDAITPKPEPEPTPGKTSGTVDNTTTPDYSQVEGVKVVSPNAPILPDASDPASCTVKPFVTIVPMKGVSYSVTVDGKAIAWGEDNPSHFEYDYGKTVTVKAKALEGYQLAKDAQTEWSWTAPTREALKCTIPAIPLEPANPAKPGPGEKPTDNPSVDKESQKLDDALKAIIEQALKERQYNTGKAVQSDTGNASTVVAEKAASAKPQKPLAHTGATVVGLSVAAVILLLAGGAIAVILRRR
ncbi:hypothetical protein INS90_03335 [Trueperella pecoris]|uniref:Uncharacterized protein n=1 Tax=Trueperella pecoris TaxID=2733571 RepID=A0A7M1R2D0_9ACTO|nr:hypothetical protein [Trueperella pecoris]QOR48323.1 hypothetical protein INS90_03335 [Trueperella pecoris]